MIEKVLLARRITDSKFLFLEETFSTTTPYFVDEPELATRKIPYNENDFSHPHDAPYYFENSERMRNWLKDCVMVAFEITTTAKELR